MINPDKRNAIYTLHQAGMGIKAISRQLSVTRKTVKAIIFQEGSVPDSLRKDKIDVEDELLRRFYRECDGYVQRIHEKLIKEKGIEIGYSTLTRLLREKEISPAKKQRCGQEEDKPGAEQQHDTSPYTVKIGDKRIKVAGSLLYFRYCKERYLQFYPSFDRFRMKCFFHEALTHFKYCAENCIIDNTNLARLYGTGKNAVIVPEMEQFAKQYGFKFVCHEKGHSNRKAGNERGFWTVETNFFPGRIFSSLEDLNEQALKWSTKIMANRPLTKKRIIPSIAFEYEKSFLNKLPPFVQPPYLINERSTDQYGYAAFKANYYWVPGTKRHAVIILQYSKSIKIYHQRQLLAEYKLPPHGVKNQKFYPEGMSKPRYQPKHRSKPTAEEEKALRDVSEEVNLYLDFMIKEKGVKKHKIIRQLYALYRKMAKDLFVKTISRALKYQVLDVNTIERIAILLMREGNVHTPFIHVEHDFEQQETYLEGRFSGEIDLSLYDKILEDNDE